ncbi:pex22p [Saccharomyces arboricola H-6]|uniref:Peroxisome assembly protein 22 n=1 Tax=Saccharomyces arboricola (strain H-6 / AS 2.3317 / CBS 10644) TaxID=1160507 RepID=J8QB60_SACAR|nr:pex22p [Saccharomyces arboricola H-6]
MAPPSRRGLSKSRTVGLVGATVAILATSFYLYNKLTSTNGDNSVKPPDDNSISQPRKSRGSKCIIMSKSVQGLSIDWGRYANDEVVLLVPMSQTNGSFKQTIKDAFCSTGNEHKIIYCDSTDGLWSCVRRLRKLQCVLNSKDFAGSSSGTAVVPEDIGRFVNFVIDSDIEDVLIDTICN